ncbi:hypothetical protein EHO59_13825 [Leptospira semungkisensis]|uniref:Uncharacterized protein n=1 Tax=Leptospira semungkisensis TaxID=2484985 RepID=A0A4R9FR40_9LEPT|nr:hypothetical protein [Leptospira semungkisensis]TGK00993.1 hypothetical protein EHO59_13825 [Leptospira semungkisensis]
MQISVSETEWPEITLRHPDWEKKKAPSKSGSSDVLRIKTKILDHYSGSILTHLKPNDCFRSDLFGKLRFHSPRIDWIREDGITEREEKLLRLFFQELLDELRGDLVWDPELFFLCSAFLLCEDRVQDYKELLESFGSDLKEAKLGRRLLYFLDLFPEETFSLEDLSPKERLSYQHKKNGLSQEEQNELYDLVISSQEPDLLGLAFYYFKEKKEGIRNFRVLDAMISRRIREFETSEIRSFLEHFDPIHSISERFFLLKKCVSRDTLSSWVLEEKKKNGREELSETLRDSIQEGTDESLFDRFNVLKSQGMSYTLRPFELLVLWNSTLAIELDAEMISIRAKSSGSYLVQRAIAVQEFKDKKFDSFQERLPLTGRFQYTPEMVYLKAIALLETGKVEDGVQLMESLVYKFPQSDFLRLVLERYKKKS